MSILQVRTVTVVVIGLLFVIVLQCNNKPVLEDKRILKLENEKKALEAAKTEALNNYAVVAEQRDSVLKALKNKPGLDKLVIHKKHEIIRNDIVLLTDSASVQLLSANLRRKRAASHN